MPLRAAFKLLVILNIAQSESILDHPLQPYLPPASIHNNLSTITRFRRSAFDISVNLEIIYCVNDIHVHVHVYSEGELGGESVFSCVLKISGTASRSRHKIFVHKTFEFFKF